MDWKRNILYGYGLDTVTWWYLLVTGVFPMDTIHFCLIRLKFPWRQIPCLLNWYYICTLEGINILSNLRLVFLKPGRPLQTLWSWRTSFLHLLRCTKLKLFLCIHYDVAKLFNMSRALRILYQNPTLTQIPCTFLHTFSCTKWLIFIHKLINSWIPQQ